MEEGPGCTLAEKHKNCYRVAGGAVEVASRRMVSLFLLFQLQLGSRLRPSLALSKGRLWLYSTVIDEGHWLVYVH